MATTGSTALKDALQAALPAGFRGKIRYIHTPPKPCEPLFSPSAGQRPEKTRLASHFLAVSAPGGGGPAGDAAATATAVESTDLLVLGMEVFVYTTKHLTTIFVSKADSTGFMPSQPPRVPLKAIATTFLQWLLAQQLQKSPHRKVVISLFARAQAQYLFPGSSENSRKHILDDRQLIKWWARALDPVLSQPGDGRVEYQGYLTVPGFAGSELRQFYPTASRTAGGNQSWLPGHPLQRLAEARGVSLSAPPRCLLPRFPDDPKARYMQDLDDEVGLTDDGPTTSPAKRRNGQWSNIRDLGRFWEAMEFRQECSSGRMVGFLWVVVTLREPVQPPAKNVGATEASQSPPDELPSQRSFAVERDDTPTPATRQRPKKRKRQQLTGPIIPRQPRLKGGSSRLTVSSSDLNGMRHSASRRDGLLLSQEGYDKAMQTLLRLDFANTDITAQSTKKWAAEVRSICGLASDFALAIEGTAQASESHASSAAPNGAAPVNDLGSMVRKKRKADDTVAENHHVTAHGAEMASANIPAVNTLGVGVIRKKPKPAIT